MNNLRICPKCGTRSEVYAEHYNRASENYVRHSRCPKCDSRNTTYEITKEKYEEISNIIKKYKKISKVVPLMLEEI